MAGRREDFLVVLGNLLFSANNPFQTNMAYINDESYKEKLLARLHNDYSKAGAIAYVHKYRHMHSIVAQKELGTIGNDILDLVK
jgi:hypothetical protein